MFVDTAYSVGAAVGNVYTILNRSLRGASRPSLEALCTPAQ